MHLTHKQETRAASPPHNKHDQICVEIIHDTDTSKIEREEKSARLFAFTVLGFDLFSLLFAVVGRLIITIRSSRAVHTYAENDTQQRDSSMSRDKRIELLCAPSLQTARGETQRRRLVSV